MTKKQLAALILLGLAVAAIAFLAFNGDDDHRSNEDVRKQNREILRDSQLDGPGDFSLPQRSGASKQR